MKKIIAAMAVLACLLSAGCSVQGPVDETAALQSRVDQLQSEPDALGADTPDEVPAQPAQEFAKTTDSYDLSPLETAVEDIAIRVAAAAPTGDAATDRAAFLELHGELEGVEVLVDRMDDAIEADVRSGALSREDYRVLDRRIDDLDDRLDRAEDALEFAFGVDS